MHKVVSIQVALLREAFFTDLTNVGWAFSSPLCFCHSPGAGAFESFLMPFQVAVVTKCLLTVGALVWLQPQVDELVLLQVIQLDERLLADVALMGSLVHMRHLMESHGGALRETLPAH